MEDVVNSPNHYNNSKLGDIECIDVARHLDFCHGNVLKYAWRAGLKSDDASQDISKAIKYLSFYAEDGAPLLSDGTVSTLQNFVNRIYDNGLVVDLRVLCIVGLIESFIEMNISKTYAILELLQEKAGNNE